MKDVSFDKLYSPETEIGVMSAVIFGQNVYEYVRDMLSKELFTDYDCCKAYEAIEQIAEEGKIPDWQEMDGRLRKENVEITRFMTTEHYSYELTKQRIIFLRDLSIRRRLAGIFYKGQVMASDPTITLEDVQQLFKEFDAVVNNNAGEQMQQFGDVLGMLMNDVALRQQDKGEHGMMTGLRVFDSRFGFHGGDLIVFAGGTSTGKSTLSTTIAYNMGVEGIPSAYYSMEMGAKQLTARIIARHVRVSSSVTLYGKLSDDEYNRVFDGSLKLKALPIYFDENSKTSFTRICGSVRRMVKKYGVRIVFIDYLQILANGHGDNREEMLGDMARDLKRLAVELDIPIVAISQLNRAGELRGSGQIEEACDMNVLLTRGKNNVTELTIKKGRNVGIGKGLVRFNGELSYFCDYEAGDPDTPYQEKTEKLPF